MNVRNALLGLFVVLTIAFASTTFYEAASRSTMTSTSTVTSTSTTTSTTTSTQEVPCAGQQVWNSSIAGNAVPVLLMQPNSTALICVTYQSVWGGNATQFQQVAQMVNVPYNFSMQVYKEHCFTTGQNSFGCTDTTSHSFSIAAYPTSVQPTAATDYVTVLFVVTALGNSTGFYDGAAPYDGCQGTPLAVGYSPSQVNGSDFGPHLIHPCAFSVLTPSSVSVSGMSFEYILASEFPPAP